MGEEQGPQEVARAGAEEIRAWLVLHRGGAPFLSAADGALLADWIEAGVPIPTILRGIEIVAERRRAKKKRPALTLRSCKSVVERLAAKGGEWRVPIDLGERLAPEAGTGEPAVAEALAALAALDGPAADRAQAACAVLRRFHERVWRELPEAERQALYAEAEAELEPLRDELGAEGMLRAREELARDQVRARYPSLSTTRVWEEFGLGLA